MSSSSFHIRPKAGLIISIVSIIALVFVVGIDELWLKDARANSAKPDFSSFDNVKEKKAAFFSYLRPLIDEQNARIRELREELLSLKEQSALTEDEKAWLIALAERYKLDLESAPDKNDLDALLKRVEELPASLVLSQAAIESAWGTSRFAREGNNFFGQWCFKEGCGLIPGRRDEGARHEVAVFDTTEEAISSYFRNINSHAAYSEFRELRYQARINEQPIHGCVLAKGLGSYSERGVHYINEVRQMIRINDLTPYGEAPCRDLPEPEPTKNQDMATNKTTNQEADLPAKTNPSSDGDTTKQLAVSQSDSPAG